MLGLEGEFGICAFVVDCNVFGIDGPKFEADTIVIEGWVEETDAILACISCSCKLCPVIIAGCPRLPPAACCS